jgi:antirestriction protein ArdC
MEQGALPWVRPLVRPWSRSGINILILWDAVIRRGFANQEWLTFRQALGLRGHVRKGERGTTICFADSFVPKANASGPRKAATIRLPCRS